MDVITDPEVLRGAQQDGRKLMIILATCLGALTYSAISSFVFDLFLIRSLFEGRRYPNFFQALTRLTYFLAKAAGLFYFISGLLITTDGIDCTTVTRCHQVGFYFLQVNNHWLFASRNLATWRTHRNFPLIFVYSVCGIFVMISFAFLCIWDGQLGHVIEPLGCVYALNDQTRPRMSFALPLLFFGITFHSINMILAAIRFAGLAKSSRSQSHPGAPWWKWPIRMIAVKMPTGMPISLARAREEAPQPDVLADLLIRHGMHYWILCLIAAVVLVAVPLLLRVNSWHFSAGILLYTFLDTEMGSRIFRNTVLLAQSARPSTSGGLTSSGSLQNTGSASAKSPGRSSLHWVPSSRENHSSYLRQASQDGAHFHKEELSSPGFGSGSDPLRMGAPLASRQSSWTAASETRARLWQEYEMERETELGSAFPMSPIVPQKFRR